MRDGKKKPLYRKINTRARGVHHYHGGDFRNHRSSKNADLISMRSGIRRGLDYTPLFRFLISRVGAVRTEFIAKQFLDWTSPIPYIGWFPFRRTKCELSFVLVKAHILVGCM
jgi:hypothetical protein